MVVDLNERRKRAPASKTNVGVGVPDPKFDTTVDQLIKSVDQSIGIVTTALNKYLKQNKQKGQKDEAFSEILQKTLMDTMISEGEKLAQSVPFGKAIIVAAKLSSAFAEGIGDGLATVNLELVKEYEGDFDKLRGDLDDEGIAIIQNARRHKATAIKNLPVILTGGIQSVTNKALDMLEDSLKKSLASNIKNIASQLAKKLPQQYQLVSIFSEAVKDAADKIGPGRKKIYSLVFSHVSSAFIQQLSDENLKTKLKNIPDIVKSKEPLDIAILSGIIEASQNTLLESIANKLDVSGAAAEFRALLLDQVKTIIDMLKEDPTVKEVKELEEGNVNANRVSVSEGTDGKLTVSIPRDIFFSLDVADNSRLIAEKKRFYIAWDVYQDEFNAHNSALKVTILKYRRQISISNEKERVSVKNRLEDAFVKDRKKRDDELKRSYTDLVRAFGDTVRPSYITKEYFSQLVRTPRIWSATAPFWDRDTYINY